MSDCCSSGSGILFDFHGQRIGAGGGIIGCYGSRTSDLSVNEASQPGLRAALLDTNPATAFDPFLNFNARNTNAAREQVYVTLHNSGEYELPIGYATLNGDLFNLPAGPVSFALGDEYDASRWTRNRDSLNTTFQSIGSTDGEGARVNRDVWSIYEEVRVPFTIRNDKSRRKRLLGLTNFGDPIARFNTNY